MNEQEVFDKVATHLLKQGKRARRLHRGSTICAYRGDDGSMCAVGCLIKDSEYSPSFECKPSFDPDVRAAVINSVGDVGVNLLRELQGAHDNAVDGPGFQDDVKRALKSVAEYNNLSTEVLSCATK